MGNLVLASEIYHLSKLKLHYLEVSSEALTQLNDHTETGKFNQRVIIKINDSIEWQAGIVALGEGKGYITLSKARMKSLDVHLGDTLSFTLTKDTSEYGHEYPRELEEVLLQDPEAKQRFEQLSPGKQRTLIYYILQVKSSDKRIERSLLFMNNLKRSPLGKETMRMLFGKE
jgi:hypothetical protein